MPFPKVEIEAYLTNSVKLDIRAALKRVPAHGQARLIRLPVEEFSKVMDKLVQGKWTPFAPVLHGLPVDQCIGTMPEIVVVYDDDTNVAQTVTTEMEIVNA